MKKCVKLPGLPSRDRCCGYFDLSWNYLTSKCFSRRVSTSPFFNMVKKDKENEIKNHHKNAKVSSSKITSHTSITEPLLRKNQKLLIDIHSLESSLFVLNKYKTSGGNTSLSNSLSMYLKECLDCIRDYQHIVMTDLKLIEIKNMIINVQKNISLWDILYQENSTLFGGKELEFRGFFSMILHECHDLMFYFTQERYCYINENQMNKLLKRWRLLHTLSKIFIDIVQDILKNAETHSLHHDTVLFPFCRTLNLDQYQDIKKLDFTPFFEDIGTMYNPPLRFALKMLVQVTASFERTSSSRILPVFFKEMLFLMHNGYYFLNSAKAAVIANTFHQLITSEKGKEMWSLSESRYARIFNTLLSPPVKYSLLFPGYGNQQMHQFGVSGDGNKQAEFENIQQSAEKIVGEQHEIERTSSKSGNKWMQSNGNVSMKQLVEYYQDLIRRIKREDIKPAMIRFISNESPTIHFMNSFSQINSVSMIERGFNFVKKKIFKYYNNSFYEKNCQNNGTIMVHIHGGGFISMSSETHECYLRRWTGRTRIPIFSIDYELAPDATYPIQIQQCYDAYQWLVKHAVDIVGYNVKKIILAGDSAGGNICLSLLQRLVYENERTPDLLVLNYPATYLAASASPSRLLSLTDPLLNHNLLLMCLKSYIFPSSKETHSEKTRESSELDGTCKLDGTRNPFLSPALAPIEIVSKFPPTYFGVASLDPLFDDTVFMAKKIAKHSSHTVKLNIFDGIGHGYLNYSFPSLPSASFASDKVCDWIMEQMKEN